MNFMIFDILKCFKVQTSSACALCDGTPVTTEKIPASSRYRTGGR